MKRIARYELVTKIALHLQQEMTTTQINFFLGGFAVEHPGEKMASSKRTYVMELLESESDRKIVRIADELGIKSPKATTEGTHKLTDYLESDGLEAAREDFDRALESIESDPSQAISSSCSTLESICKAILDNLGEEYPRDESLQPLIKKVSKCLDLAPSGKADPEIKRILGGLENVSFGIAVLRTKFSSAHGRGKKQHNYRLSSRHARLAVNAAATAGYFLIETYLQNHG